MEEKEISLSGRTTDAPRVLLTETTRWASAARLAMGLSEAGSHVSALCPTRDPLMKTRAVRRTFRYDGLRPLDSLIAAIEATNPQIIIPCDDRAVHHLHELHRRSRRQQSGKRVADLIENSLGSPESYPIVSARYELLQIAREEGLRVPKSQPIHTIDDLRSWQVSEGFPWVLKADATFGGRGIRIAHNEIEAHQCLLELTRLFGIGRAIKRLFVNRDSFWLRPWWNGYRPPVLVQSYVHGQPANCAVVCWKGKILAGMGVQVIQADGATGPASIVRVVDNPEMMLAAERIARRLGLSGFFGLDFMVDGSGATYLIEMNPRSTPLSHLQLGKGRDLVGEIWSQLSGQPSREIPAITQNNLIAYFPQAWVVKNEFLQSSFQDVPQGEPDLVEELLRPTSNRSLFSHAVDQWVRMKNLASEFVKTR